jgi:hypothetical protein
VKVTEVLKVTGLAGVGVTPIVGLSMLMMYVSAEAVVAVEKLASPEYVAVIKLAPAGKVAMVQVAC